MATSAQHTAQSVSLRDRILDASRDIVVRDGFSALSMRKVADVIGYSPASLYTYFSSRDAIAQALCVEAHAQLLAALQTSKTSGNPQDRLKPAAYAYVAFGREHPQMYRLMFMDHSSHAEAAINSVGSSVGSSVDSSGSSIRALFAAALSGGSPSPSPSPTRGSASAEALWAALHGIVALSLTYPACLQEPLEDLVDLTLVSFLNANKKPVRRAPLTQSSS